MPAGTWYIMTMTLHQTSTSMNPTAMVPNVLGRLGWQRTMDTVEWVWLMIATSEVREYRGKTRYRALKIPISISGLKVDFSMVTDLIEAYALGYNYSHVQIYSNSWGPPGQGFIVSGPGILVELTLLYGIIEVCV